MDVEVQTVTCPEAKSYSLGCAGNVVAAAVPAKRTAAAPSLIQLTSSVRLLTLLLFGRTRLIGGADLLLTALLWWGIGPVNQFQKGTRGKLHVCILLSSSHKLTYVLLKERVEPQLLVGEESGKLLAH